jgi:hypothetical protein
MIVTDPASGRIPVITPRHEHPRSTKRGTDMKRTTLAATVIGALMVSATAFGIGAAVDSPRSLMSPVDYGAAKKAIESDERLAISRCRELDGREKDVCKAEARANERIRKAELEADYRGTAAAAADAKLVRAKAQYELAKAKCGGEHGEGKLSCLRSARADKAKALAGSKLAST